MCGKANDISSNKAPALSQTSDIVDYSLAEVSLCEHSETGNSPRESKQLLVIVIDLTLDEDESSNLGQCIIKLLQSIPPNTHIAIIGFSSVVSIYHLSPGNVAESDIVESTHGDSDRLLNVKLDESRLGRYVMPVSACINQVSTILRSANNYYQDVPIHLRPRCLITAIHAAWRLIYLTLMSPSASRNRENHNDGFCLKRVMVCAGGACNFGPGAGAPSDLHLHPDAKRRIDKDAIEHNEDLAKDLTRVGALVDIFGAGCCPLNVPTLYPLTQNTGGALQVYEGFGEEYLSCLLAAFRRFTGKEATMDFRVSEGIEIEHVIGPIKLLTGATKRSSSCMTHNAVCMTSVERGHGVAVSFKLKRDLAFESAYFQIEICTQGCTSGHGDTPGNGFRHRVVTSEISVTEDGREFIASIDPTAIGVMIAKKSLLSVRKAMYTQKTIQSLKKEIGKRMYDIGYKFSPRVSGQSMWSKPLCVLKEKLAVLAEILYHFCRCPAMSDSTGHIDEKIVLFARLISADMATSVLMIWPRLTVIQPSPSGHVVVAENVAAVDIVTQMHNTLVLDCGTSVYVWMKRSMVDKDVSDENCYRNFIEDLTRGRFPSPHTYLCPENSPNFRYIQAKLVPLRKDHPDEQTRQLPALNSVDEGRLKEIRAHLLTSFQYTDEPSFLEWCKQHNITVNQPLSTRGTC